MIKKLDILNRKILVNILCIICILCAVVAIITSNLSTDVGYESSIYTSIPVLLWISVFLLIIVGLVTIMDQIFNDKIYQSNLWFVGLFLIFLSYTICQSLYIVRGYYFWCMEDPASHVGYVNNILLTGHVPSELFYPILHIYTSQISLLLNTDVITLHKVLPLIFGMLYIPFIYILSKMIFSEKSQIILSTIAGSTFINGWYLNFTPNGLSNLFFPLLLFLFLKVTSTKDIRWEILIVIMAFFYPIFHPVPAFIFIIFLSVQFLPTYTFNKLNNLTAPITKKEPFLRFKMTLIILILVWSITWISSFYIWEATIWNTNKLINEGGPTKISELADSISYAQGYGYNVVEQVLKVMGGPLVYVIISIVSFPIIWKERNNEKLNNLFSFYGPLLFIWLFITIFYFSNLSFSPLRIVTYSTIISTLFVGYFLNYLIKKIKFEHKKIFVYFFLGSIFLLSLVWINAILTLYPSPYDRGINYQTPLSEIEGMDWLFGNKNLNLEITGITIAPFRFGDFILTPEQSKLQKLHKWALPDYLKVPYHFGYDNNSSLSSYYNQSLYMGIDEKDKLIYKDLFPEVANIRWTSSDFEKLNGDVSIKKIYSNKKFEIFYIDGIGKM